MEASPSGPPDSANAERDALRIQAAAVAAQQVALALEEERLRQKSAALERQENQLASHFEEREQRLREIQEQIRKDRDSLKGDRKAAEAERQELRAGLLKEREEVRAAVEAARIERSRLTGLRKRWRKRWRKHWELRDAEYKRSEAALSAARGEIAREADALRRERERLAHAKLRANGEIELDRRKLQEGWEELALSQQQWDTCLNHENDLREQRTKELDARSTAVAAAEQSLAEQQRDWTRRRELLALEIAGLENRIRNQRTLLTPDIAADPLFPPAVAPPRPDVFANVPIPADLGGAAGELHDQRKHLLEQWDRLLTIQAAWEQERRTLLAEIDAAARGLDERERQLSSQEAELAAEYSTLRRRQDTIDRLRTELEGKRARLAVREAAFESEQAARKSELRAREESVEREASRLLSLRQRWGDRRRDELGEIKLAQTRSEEARSAYLELWQNCQSRRAALTQEERELATQALAIERLRQETLSRAPDAVAAERRLAKLEQRNRARLEAHERELVKGQKALLAEAARLGSEWKRLQAEEQELLARREELAQHLETRARAEAEAEADEHRRGEELRKLREAHARDSRELSTLRDEIELIANNLIDDGPSHLDERQAA